MKKYLVLVFILVASFSWAEVMTRDYIYDAISIVDEYFPVGSEVPIIIKDHTAYVQFRGDVAEEIIMDDSYYNTINCIGDLIHEVTHIYQVEVLGYDTGWSTGILNKDLYKINKSKMRKGKVNPEMEAKIVTLVILRLESGKRIDKVYKEYVLREFPGIFNNRF